MGCSDRHLRSEQQSPISSLFEITVNLSSPHGCCPFCSDSVLCFLSLDDFGQVVLFLGFCPMHCTFLVKTVKNVPSIARCLWGVCVCVCVQNCSYLRNTPG
jgi:hypothetical protein